jgi:hypothetical protein
LKPGKHGQGSTAGRMFLGRSCPPQAAPVDYSGKGIQLRLHFALSGKGSKNANDCSCFILVWSVTSPLSIVLVRVHVISTGGSAVPWRLAVGLCNDHSATFCELVITHHSGATIGRHPPPLVQTDCAEAGFNVCPSLTCHCQLSGLSPTVFRV